MGSRRYRIRFIAAFDYDRDFTDTAAPRFLTSV